MNYPSYFQKTAENGLNHKGKAQQNKINSLNIKKCYEEDQDSYLIKGTDSLEVKDLKGKMKIIMQKLSTNRKQKQQLQKENQNLQKQIIALRNNVRHMIPGFSNTSSNFPMSNQIIAKFLQFYKYDCLDRFFQNLMEAELSMKGIIYFYHYSFTQILKLIDNYFQQAHDLIKTTGCFDNLQGPIMNVLRKSYQTTYQKILRKILQRNSIQKITTSLIEKLSLNTKQDDQIQTTIKQYLQKLLQLGLFCRIIDPPLKVQLESIGKKIKFNSILNDPLDGFIKNKQDCWIVLPQVRKIENEQIVIKSMVLKTNYFDDNQENQDEKD